MTVLHEIIAVEADKEGYVKRSYQEMITLFKNKVERFQGFERTLKLKGSEEEVRNEEQAESEFKKLDTTVPKELVYLSKVVSDYFDVVYQKDLANQEAKADLVIDGTTIASNVPATTLLGLETRLKNLRLVFDEIPTLSPGADWKIDEAMGTDIYKDQHPEIRPKTRKDFEYKILVQPTANHPAQVEKWNIDKEIGHFYKTKWSGCISVAAKSELLSKLDKLLQAVKQARQRANNQEVNTHARLGEKLFEYLLK